jgi:hypothetical protein
MMDIFMKNAFFLILSLLLILMQGCAPVETPTSTDEPLVSDWSIPAPTGNTAVIFGELHSTTDAPVGDMIFLTENLAYGHPELPSTISFSFQNSPRAIVDVDRGYFYFENVEPAPNYVIAVLSGPGEFIYVTEEDGETPKMIVVEAGESLDLGRLLIEIPEFN